MNIGEAIKLIRKSVSLSQTELGERLGVSQMMISQYEKSKRIPKAETIQKITCAILDKECDFDYELLELLSKEAEHDEAIKIMVHSIVKKFEKSNPDFFNAIKEIIETHPFQKAKQQTAFLNFLDSLGYKYVDGAWYDSSLDEIGMIQYKSENIEIPLTRKDFEKLEQAVSNNDELELYRLRREKGL